jgi:amino acid permease
MNFVENNVNSELLNIVNKHKKKALDNNTQIKKRRNYNNNLNTYLKIYILFHIICFIVSIWLYFRCNKDLNPLNLLGALLFSPIYIIYMVLQSDFKKRCNFK